MADINRTVATWTLATPIEYARRDCLYFPFMTDSTQNKSALRPSRLRFAEMVAVAAALCVIGGITWLMWLVAPDVYASVSGFLNDEASSLRWTSTAQRALFALLLVGPVCMGALWSSKNLLGTRNTYGKATRASLNALEMIGLLLLVATVILIPVFAVAISSSLRPLVAALAMALMLVLAFGTWTVYRD